MANTKFCDVTTHNRKQNQKYTIDDYYESDYQTYLSELDLRMEQEEYEQYKKNTKCTFTRRHPFDKNMCIQQRSHKRKIIKKQLKAEKDIRCHLMLQSLNEIPDDMVKIILSYVFASASYVSNYTEIFCQNPTGVINKQLNVDQLNKITYITDNKESYYMNFKERCGMFNLVYDQKRYNFMKCHLNENYKSYHKYFRPLCFDENGVDYDSDYDEEFDYDSYFQSNLERIQDYICDSDYDSENEMDNVQRCYSSYVSLMDMKYMQFSKYCNNCTYTQYKCVHCKSCAKSYNVTEMCI